MSFHFEYSREIVNVNESVEIRRVLKIRIKVFTLWYILDMYVRGIEHIFNYGIGIRCEFQGAYIVLIELFIILLHKNRIKTNCLDIVLIVKEELRERAVISQKHLAASRSVIVQPACTARIVHETS